MLRGAAAILAFLSVAGCATDVPLVARLSGLDVNPATALTERAVLGGEIRLASPGGYCIDALSVRDTGEDAFALIAPCRAFGLRGGRAPDAALMSVAVAPAGTAVGASFDPAEMAAFIAREDGRAMLSRAGRADSVRVLSVDPRRDSIRVALTDTSDGAPPGVEARYWRSFLALDGRLVALSVYSMAAEPLAGDAAAGRLLDALARALRGANPAAQLRDA